MKFSAFLSCVKVNKCVKFRIPRYKGCKVGIFRISPIVDPEIAANTFNTFFTSVFDNYPKADLINFDTWCEDNDMTLHLGKTIAMFLSTKQGTSKIMSDPAVISLHDSTIQVSEQEKLLGVFIDNNLSWSTHMENTLKNAIHYCISWVG